MSSNWRAKVSLFDRHLKEYDGHQSDSIVFFVGCHDNDCSQAPISFVAEIHVDVYLCCRQEHSECGVLNKKHGRGWSLFLARDGVKDILGVATKILLT